MRPPRPLRAVLFDWDGTLADTAEASFRCYVRMFAELGIDFDRETYRRTYSPDWYHTFRCLGLPQERWADADERWLRYFAEETVELIDGARAALEALRRRGVTQAIVTSGSRPRIERELAAHGLNEHFSDVVCGHDTERRKPHPDPLHLALRRLGVPAHEAAYVGDSPEDVMMAKAANVYAVAVPGAYPNRDALATAGADVIAEDLAGAVGALIS
ncbi:MAG TPA: HAD family hydrolase [Thermoanaerobaculia bacterium]|nr:HAD family hydrolase [Thermoanaerobaculia bacterium]